MTDSDAYGVMRAHLEAVNREAIRLEAWTLAAGASELLDELEFVQAVEAHAERMDPPE